MTETTSNTGELRADERSLSGFLTTFIALGALVMVAPFFWLIIASTYPTSEIFTTPPHVTPGSAFWDNLVKLFSSAGFADALRNSLVVSIVSTSLAVFVCAAAGYAFATELSRKSGA